MYPVLFHIGSYKFYSFGLMAALSIILPALFIARPIIKRGGVGNDFIYEAIVGTAVGGFAGARIYYVIENWSKVRHDFWGSLFSGSGFVWYGGLIGGVPLVMLLARLRKVSLGLLFNAAKEVSPADDDADLNAKRVNLGDFGGNSRDLVDIQAKTALSGQRLTR